VTNLSSHEQRKANLRLALILASLAGVFLAGFVAKIWWMGP
jgi:hypothetical protein